MPVEETVTLVSAYAGDRIPGIEISDPTSRVSWDDLDDETQEWAWSLGYGPDNPDELLYILPPGVEVQPGFPSRQATIRRP